MPTLVHLADEKDATSIKRNGIKIGKHRQGIYCMPVTPNFFMSHQWLRELKRRGVKTYVAVYFKAPSKTMVYAGYFNSDHKHITLGEAIKEMQDTPLGYELIIDRKIEAKEIEKIINITQTVGWRVSPDAKGRKPCSCDFCIRGDIKANRLRQKTGKTIKKSTYKELLEQLSTEKDLYKMGDLLGAISSKARKTDPKELLFLLNTNSPMIEEEYAIALKKFRHKNTKGILLDLLQKENADTREYAADSLLQLYGTEAAKLLLPMQDAAIQTAIKDWQDEKKNNFSQGE